MNFIDYQTEALRTAKFYKTLSANLLHASIGLSTEVGEFNTEVKRHAIYEKPLTPEMKAHMTEELGDIMWYIALAADNLGVTMEQLAVANIAKLSRRFPERYSDASAEGRADKGGADARSS